MGFYRRGEVVPYRKCSLCRSVEAFPDCHTKRCQSVPSGVGWRVAEFLSPISEHLGPTSQRCLRADVVLLLLWRMLFHSLPNLDGNECELKSRDPNGPPYLCIVVQVIFISDSSFFFLLLTPPPPSSYRCLLLDPSCCVKSQFLVL